MKSIIEKKLVSIDLDSPPKNPKDLIEAYLTIFPFSKTDKKIYNSFVDSLIDDCMTFIMAGTETTLSMTRMMIYRLALNP